MPPPLNRKSIISGLRIFIFLTLSAFILIFTLTGNRETFRALNHFRYSYFLWASLLIGVDFVSGSSRIFIFTRKMSKTAGKKTFISAFKANLANIFLAAATPFQTGGGVAQIYMLHRDGISIPGAVSVSIMNFIATLSMLLIAGICILQWMTHTFTDFRFRFILSFSSVIFYMVTFLFIFFLLRPITLGHLLEKLLIQWGNHWKKRSLTFHRLAEKIHDFVTEYQSHIRYFWKHEKWTLFHNIWLTVVLYFNKCLMAYVVLKGMGLEIPFMKVISIQMLLIFLIYFAPTPGASFLAETSTAALMALIIPEHLLSLFSVLWRFFTTYFGVIVGGVILLRSIGLNPIPKRSPLLTE